jgi:hypothetical protein
MGRGLGREVAQKSHWGYWPAPRQRLEASRAGQPTMTMGPLRGVFAGAFAWYLIYTCVRSENVAKKLSRISELILTVVISGLTSETNERDASTPTPPRGRSPGVSSIFRRAAPSFIAEA